MVAGAMVFLGSMAIRAWRRSQNRILLFVAGAFGVFAIKELVTAYGLWKGVPGHEDLELLVTVMDVVIAGLLIAPFVFRPRRA